MRKRIIGTVLWFYAAWCLGAFVVFLAASPVDPSLVPALLVAAFVWMDPAARMWRRGTTSTQHAASGQLTTAAAPAR